MLGNVCPGQPPLLSDQGESNLTQEILINPDANTDTTKSVWHFLQLEYYLTYKYVTSDMKRAENAKATLSDT